MTWMQRVGGGSFDLMAPRPHQVDFEEIAHALSHLCRFAGHTRKFYSVAEHCCRVADILPPPLRIYGLLHDAKEAYIGDITTPVKCCLRPPTLQQFVTAVEKPIDSAIYAAAGIDTPPPSVAEAVKFADETLLVTEKRDLMAPSKRAWGRYEHITPLPDRIAPWASDKSRKEFLRRLELWRP